MEVTTDPSSTGAVRLLFVEDSEADFKLVVLAIAREFRQCECRRVEGADAMRVALTEATWDAVISDWTLPNFGALAALTVLKEFGLDIPFIIVSGTVGEEAAVESIRAGAHDYVLKDNFARLFSVLDRELRESKIRAMRRDVDCALVERTARLASMNEDLQRTQTSLRLALQVRDEFISVASHELRTPLTSLKLQVASVIRHCKSTPSVAEQLKRIDRQADRLTALITQLLDVSRISGNRLQLQAEDMDLGELVQDVASRFVLDLKHCGSQLSVDADRPTKGSWDRERMDQVVTNLLSNAIKFGAGKPIEVSVDPSNGGGARLSVRDHGIGIDADSLERIFDRFERAVSVRHFGGLGLGLWIVRQIVEASGGTISVQSQVGLGSLFRVELPSLLEDVKYAADGAVVLVIDDDADIREAMKMVLGEEGYTVALSSSGMEAFDYLRSHAVPSLILLDLMMPEMDGYEFRSRQMADPGLRQIPVVVATGAGTTHLRTPELEGAAVLTKPVDLEALLSTVNAHRSRDAYPGRVRGAPTSQP